MISKKQGFTLVETMIAVILSTMISYFLISLLYGGQKTATKYTGKVATIQQANTILHKLRMIFRGSKELDVANPSTVNGTSFEGGAFSILYRPDIEALEVSGAKKEILGKGQIYSFEVKAPLSRYKNIYQIKLKFKNPEASGPSEANGLEFRTIVSERVLQEVPDPAWVKNSNQECPPDCPSP